MGGVDPNQAARNDAAVLASPSTNATDRPAARTPAPLRATAPTGALELSSIFQPVMSTGPAPRLVTSNQSAAYGVEPLLHGETSETISVVAFVPGDPVSIPSAARKAPFVPAVLRVEISGSGSSVLPRPAVLSK